MSSSRNDFPLEALNIHGPNFLKHALTSCTDPLKAIEEFQVTNGILLPSLRPMLPLLDLHGVRRLDFHMSVVEALREKLTAHINEIGKSEGKERDKKLKELLVKSFPVVKVKALRPIVMAILKNTPQIEDSYLKVLVRDRDLYNDTDTEVKRQIWKDNQSLFGDEVSPLLSQYISEKENVLFDHSNLSTQFFGPSPKVRRQGEVVQKLAHMIGNSVKLYDMVLQFLRTLFLRTRNVHYCTLRAELLMALHDLEVQDIISIDPCHKFTWCLDACIREKNVDIKRSRELQGFLDNVKRGQEQVLGDLSMTLCDPYAINFLATSAIKILHHLIFNEGMPRLSAAKKMEIKRAVQASPDFAETVELCFATGPPSMQKISKLMKRIVNVFLCVTQLGFCCVYFVFISENLKQVLDYHGYEMDVHLHMAIILLPILLTALVRNLKYLAPLSTVANIFMIVGLVITVYYTTQDLPSVSERDYVSTWSQFPLFFGTALFAFEGIGLVLPLQNEMKKPSQFKRPFGVLNIGMSVVTILYILIGSLAYIKYGDDIKGSVTLNLPESEILAQSVKIIIPLGILLTYALQFYIAVDIMFPGVQNILGPFKYPVFAELAFRCFLVLITFVMAEAIPFLNLFISLVGAFSSTALALMFPPILDLVTSYSYGDLTFVTIVKNVVIIVFGIVGCITGTYESITAIVEAFQKQS